MTLDLDSTKQEIKLLNSNIAYKDILSEITVPGSMNAIDAYVENGVVVIIITIVSGTTGMVTANINDKYAPRCNVYGIQNYGSTASDSGKILSAVVESDGAIKIWLNNNVLNQSEQVSFVYPLKNTLS